MTSRPSAEWVAVCFEPNPYPRDEWLESNLRPGPRPPESLGSADCLLDVLDGVAEGRSGTCPFARVSDERSDLLPARRSVRLGDAKARASLRKVGSASKEA